MLSRPLSISFNCLFGGENMNQEKKPGRNIFRMAKECGITAGSILMALCCMAALVVICWIAWLAMNEVFVLAVGFIADCLWLVTYPASYFAAQTGISLIWWLIAFVVIWGVATIGQTSGDGVICTGIVIYICGWAIVFLNWMITTYS